MADYSLEEKLQLEEEYLGVYLSGHPTEGYERLKLAKKIRLITEVIPKQTVSVLVMIKNIREIRTKKKGN